jgi:hypothetical protein
VQSALYIDQGEGGDAGSDLLCAFVVMLGYPGEGKNLIEKTEQTHNQGSRAGARSSRTLELNANVIAEILTATRGCRRGRRAS